MGLRNKDDEPDLSTDMPVEVAATKPVVVLDGRQRCRPACPLVRLGHAVIDERLSEGWTLEGLVDYYEAGVGLKPPPWSWVMSGNPVFNERRFTTIANSVPSNEVMTIEGALQKASILFGALLVGMLVMFGAYAVSTPARPAQAARGCGRDHRSIGAFILVIGLVFVRPKGTPTFAMTAYVGLEILFLSSFTYIMEFAYPGIALQAGLVTAGITGSMTMLYTSRVIRVGPRFNMVMAALVSTVMFVYVGQFLLYLVGGVTFLHPRQRPHRHRLQRRHRGGSVLHPAQRLLLHRDGRQARLPEAHGMVGCFRSADERGLDLHRGAPAHQQAPRLSSTIGDSNDAKPAGCDLRDWHAGGEARERFVATMGDALKDIGFFALTGHGISADAIGRAATIGRFFHLDDATKRTYEQADMFRQRGYTPYGVEHAKDNEPDLKEFWRTGRTLPDGHPSGPFPEISGRRPTFPTLSTTSTDSIRRWSGCR